MTNEAKQIFLSIAPLFVEKGIALQERVAAAGSDPAKCTVGGKPIIEAYAASAQEWAETFARIIDAANAGKGLKGCWARVHYTFDNALVGREQTINDVHCDDENVTLTIGRVDYLLTNAEYDKLMRTGDVIVGDYHITLVKK